MHWYIDEKQGKVTVMCASDSLSAVAIIYKPQQTSPGHYSDTAVIEVTVPQ